MTIVNYDIRSVDGVTLFLPPQPDGSKVNLALPDVYAASAQKYPIGSLAWYAGIGKKFRYVKAGENIVEATHARLVANGNYVASVDTGGVTANRDGFYGQLYAQAEIDQSYIDITLTDRAVNFFQSSYLSLSPPANPMSQYYVVASDVSTLTYTRVYLDHPLKQTVTEVTSVGIGGSPYTKVVNGSASNARYKAFIGIPFVNALEGQCLWIQTAGPVSIQPTGYADDRLPGRGENFREVFAQIDGSVMSSWMFTALTDGYQRVGYVLEATAAGYGSVFIMLQLES